MPKRGPRRPWTSEEDNVLLQGLGTYGYKWLMRRTGRTKRAIEGRARRLFSAGVTRGTYTLRRAMVETGYSRTHLRRAARALAQKWKRTRAGGAYLITEEQLHELTDWLSHDFWSKVHRLYCCRECGTETQAHHARGLCRRCYDSFWKDCVRRRRLPATVEGQSALVSKILDAPAAGRYIPILEEVRAVLEADLAPTKVHLDVLEMLA